MFRETYFDKAIAEKVRAENDKESLLHTPSGKLSASILGQPVQWQVLKTLGVGTRVYDDYTLRKFARGKQVEDWLVAQMPGVVSTQEEVEWNGVVGKIDTMIDTAGFDHNLGIIPYEVKSVTNAKFKQLMKRGEADPGHKLQAGLYAVAKGSPYYGLIYVASDDFRLLSLVYPTADIQPEIEAIIAEYNGYMQRQEVPVFVAKQKWQATKEYSQYPDWMEFNQEECQMALAYHYPEAWQKYAERKAV